MRKLATRILDVIQKEMKIDEQWMSSNSNSLTWVAHKLEQSFSVSEPFTFWAKKPYRLSQEYRWSCTLRGPKNRSADCFASSITRPLDLPMFSMLIERKCSAR